MPIPTSPVLFIKPRTSLSGPGAIPIPKIAQDASSDYEAELTFVIAKDGRDIPEDRAMEHVLGVTCGNDVSARKWQFANSQWNFSKGFDGAAPIGPVLVRPGAIGDLHGLRIKAVYQGEVVQDSNTRFVPFLVHMGRDAKQRGAGR
jgi:2-keto-4-pentenoate hydratase/2-oxohepta-3-ene-1,7-dioic acid hydratase in catechol pathway